jgi:hypothetical protein
MTSRVTPKPCSLRAAVGERELCPGEACVLWEDGCAVEILHIPVDRDRDLARHLLDLRVAVESARADTERADAYRHFAELRNLNRD